MCIESDLTLSDDLGRHWVGLATSINPVIHKPTFNAAAVVNSHMMANESKDMDYIPQLSDFNLA